MRSVGSFAGFLAVVATMVSPIALASSTTAGTVAQIISQNSGQTFFLQSGSRSGVRPTCASQDRWVLDNSTPKGQSMLSTLLLAYSMGKKVAIAGTGACTDWGDTESVLSVMIVD